jgi:hypothetical protein
LLKSLSIIGSIADKKPRLQRLLLCNPLILCCGPVCFLGFCEFIKFVAFAFEVGAGPATFTPRAHINRKRSQGTTSAVSAVCQSSAEVPTLAADD